MYKISFSFLEIIQMSNEIYSFVNDPNENIYSFKVFEYGEKVKISIDDQFEFYLDVKNLKIFSEEEFLEPFCKNVNEKSYQNQTGILKECIKEYAKLMEDEPIEQTPEKVLDEENDFQFVTRIRFSPEETKSIRDENWMDVFVCIEPNELVKFSRVCTKWYKLINHDAIWKYFCEKESLFEKNKSWKITYVHHFQRKASQYRQLLLQNIKDKKVESFEFYLTTIDSTKIQIRFPDGEKEILSWSKYTPLSAIYLFCKSKLKGIDKTRDFKLMYMNQKVKDDLSTLEELKLLGSSFTLSFQ